MTDTIITLATHGQGLSPGKNYLPMEALYTPLLVTNLLSFSAIWFSILLISDLISWADSDSLNFLQKVNLNILCQPLTSLPGTVEPRYEHLHLMLDHLFMSSSSMAFNLDVMS